MESSDGKEKGQVDLSVSRIAVSQTNFEAAPVTLMAEFASSGLEGKEVVVREDTAKAYRFVRRRKSSGSSLSSFILPPSSFD